MKRTIQSENSWPYSFPLYIAFYLSYFFYTIPCCTLKMSWKSWFLQETHDYVMATTQGLVTERIDLMFSRTPESCDHRQGDELQIVASF